MTKSSLDLYRQISDIDEFRSPMSNLGEETLERSKKEVNLEPGFRGERRIAVRLKETHDREEEIVAKTEALKVSLRLWLQEEARKGTWKRSRQPDPNGFFERVQNGHLIPLLMAVYLTLVVLLTIAS